MYYLTLVPYEIVPILEECSDKTYLTLQLNQWPVQLTLQDNSRAVFMYSEDGKVLEYKYSHQSPEQLLMHANV